MNPEAKKTLRRLVIAVPLMFAFGFALVPLYNVFCEVTGINGKVFQTDNAEKLVIEDGRPLGLQFISTNNENMPKYAIYLRENVAPQNVTITGNTLGWVEENVIRAGTCYGISICGNGFGPSGVKSALNPTAGKTIAAINLASNSRPAITGNSFRRIDSLCQLCNLFTYAGEDTNIIVDL